MLKPDAFAPSVEAIDPSRLVAEGIRGAVLDLDNTLLPRDRQDVPAAVIEWLEAAGRSGLRICLVSNNWHERVREVARDLGLPLVAKAVKPLPFAFLKAMRILGSRPSECVVIGDQLFTDVLGGKIAGCRTIMVKPQSAHDLPHTLLLRRVESLIIGADAFERHGKEPS